MCLNTEPHSLARIDLWAHAFTERTAILAFRDSGRAIERDSLQSINGAGLLLIVANVVGSDPKRHTSFNSMLTGS